MTDKCMFCNGTGKEDGFDGCVWCHSTGTTDGQKLFTAPAAVASAIDDAAIHGTGVMKISSESVEHVPLKDVLVDLKPFRLLPYGTKFRYRGTSDVWVRTQHNVIAEWPCRTWSADGSPRSSLCCFCHLDGDEDGNTLDTLVEVVDRESELSALREELARITLAYRTELDELAGRNYEIRFKLASADHRNAELTELLTEVSKQAGDHHMSHQTWNLKTQLANIHQKLEAALKPTESGESE